MEKDNKKMKIIAIIVALVVIIAIVVGVIASTANKETDDKTNTQNILDNADLKEPIESSVNVVDTQTN